MNRLWWDLSITNRILRSSNYKILPNFATPLVLYSSMSYFRGKMRDAVYVTNDGTFDLKIILHAGELRSRRHSSTYATSTFT